jgi:predicted NUDIX family phosphoesterase
MSPVINILSDDAINLRERVLVIPSEKAQFGEGVFEATQEEIITFIEKYGSYRLRTDELEQDKTVKQLVTYPLVRYNDMYLTARRADTADESRLRNYPLIGFGGHINAEDIEDVDFSKWYIRELVEELTIEETTIVSTSFLGFVNSAKNEVSLYHVGLVAIVEVTCTHIESREPDQINRLQWKTLDELNQMYLDPWSRNIVDYMSK